MEWYVLRTQPLLEERVAKELNRQDVETFLPLARIETRLSNGLLVERLRPLFRSYLFVRMDWDTAPKSVILTTRGVKGFLGYSERKPAPSFVKAEDMAELRLHLAQDGGVIRINESKPKALEPGDMVRILFGSFRDHKAKVQGIKGTRVEILLTMLNRDISVKLPHDCLVAA